MPLAVLLLDYTLYVWHVLAHKVPFLWRLHQPHHVDLDLDASTALRFHFGEMLASVPWRAAHHSMAEEETNSNWSNLLTLWDRLHGTLRLDVPQAAITIGVPAYAHPADVTLRRVLEMPFVEQRPSWSPPAM